MGPRVDFPGNNTARIGSALLHVGVVISLIAIASFPARAQTTGQPGQQPPMGEPVQPASAPAGFEVLATPYLWMPWTSVGINPSNPRIPRASGTVDFGELVSHLTWVPFMGEVEFRDGPFGVMTDYIHAPLTTGVSTRNILFSGANAGLTLDTGTAMFLYRAIAQPDQYVDVGAGVRAWGFAGGITLNEGLLPSVSVTRGNAWADPLIGARYHRDLGNGFGATAYGDVGGFGVGAHIDWQLLGTIDYAANSWIDLHAGFRSMNFNYSLPNAGLNVNMYGPILAATFHF
jgi:hypothetical protein